MVLLGDPDVDQSGRVSVAAKRRFGTGEGCAGARVDAVAEGDVLAPFLPVEAQLVGLSNSRGSRLAAPVSPYVAPAGISVPADGGR